MLPSNKAISLVSKALTMMALSLILSISLESDIADAQVNITSCDQLIGTAAAGTNLRDNPSETYIQQNDIDCSGQQITINFPSSASRFSGTYDGNGFEVSNFTVPSSTRASLFGYTQGANIQNLTIDSADVSCNTSGNCAIVSAQDASSTFDNITIRNSSLVQVGGQDNMGSIIGVGIGSQVSNITIDELLITCSQLFSGSCQNIGGAIGSLDQNSGAKGSINTANATNLTIYGRDNLGGIVGFLGESDISNATAQGTLGGYDKVGGVIGLITGDASISSTATNVSANITYDPQAYLDFVGNAGTTSTNAGGVVGRMGTYSSLNCGGLTTNYTAKSLANTSNVGGVVGILVSVTALSDVDSFVIENCNSNFSISGRSAVGGIVGNADEGRINNVNASGIIKAQGSNPANFGGIVGTMDFDSPATRPGISNCSFNGSIFVDDILVSTQNMGGVAGDVDNVSVDTCNVNANINAPETTRVGGIIGQASGLNNSSENSVTNSSFNGEIKGRTNVGGILGNSTYYDISNSFTSGSILGNTEDTSQYFGGLIGFSTGTSTDISNITQSSSSMDVYDVVGSAGGLVGYATFTSITQSFATGDVTAFTSYAGGLIGRVASGNSSVIIDQVYSTGDVTGGINYTGGLIGDLPNATQVSNAYSLGKVLGNNFVGGLIGGFSNGSLTNSFSAGLVEGSSNTGGLIGSGNATTSATESFWDTDTSNQSSSYDGEGKTTLELFTPSTFSAWDTTTIWEACDNAYPVLRNLSQSCPIPDPVIFTVNSSADTSDDNIGDGFCSNSEGQCTLRGAIEEINALNNGALNIINFDLPSSETVISISSNLPVLSNLQVSVDGTSQSAYIGEPVVAIDATSLSSTNPILEFSNTDDSELKGLSIYGRSDLSNATIQITNSSNFKLKNNLIGYNLAQAYIDTNSTNSVLVSNSDNLELTNNTLANAVFVEDSENSDITNNTLDLSNNSTSDYAIQFVDGQNSLISKNTISNIDRGVVIRDDSSSEPVLDNNVRENIGENVLLMIDLLDDSNSDTDGKNDNDVDDTDNGPNNLLNTPELTSASYDNSTRILTIDGVFNSDDGDYIFDLYSSDGTNEAINYLGYFLEAVTSNNLSFTAKTLIVPERGIAPSFVSATAQDKDGNTSELSDPVAVDAILITSCDQLAGGNPASAADHIEDDYTAFYRLANDIDCSTYTGGNSFDPIGSNTSSQYFRGVFDGAGFTISNLEISETTSYNGLFARTQGAIIQNLTLENIDVTCSGTFADYCGSFSGYSQRTSFSNITLTQGTGSGVNSDGTYTGGLSGYILGTDVIDVSSDVDVLASTTNENYTGGITGYARYFQPTNRAYIYNNLINVSVDANVSGFSNTGGVVGFAQDTIADNISFNGQLNHGGNTIGGLMGSLSSSTFGNLTSELKNSTVTVVTVSEASSNRSELGGALGEILDAQLKNVNITADIDATNYGTVGGAVGYALGDTDQIDSNQLLDSTTSSIEFIDTDSNINNANSTTGGVIGNANYYKISNVSYEGDVLHPTSTGLESNIGGIVGLGNYLDIRNSTATSATPISYPRTTSGGAIGSLSNSYIDNISSNISLPNVSTNGGGLVGSISNVNIYNSHATGSLGIFRDQSSTAAIGGLVGRCQSTFCNIYNSYATGDVTGERLSVGGLVGSLASNEATIQNSYATGSVVVETGAAGGLIGDVQVGSTRTHSILNSYATGAISSVNYGYLGGLVGRVSSSGILNITESYSSSPLNTTTNSTTSYSMCGGLIGQADATINVLRSYSYGSINCPSITSGGTSVHGVGGLIGDMDGGTVVESYSHSDVTVNYSSDFVSASARVGGLIGYISETTTIEDSFSTGDLTNLYTPVTPGNEPTLGGLVGGSLSTTYIDSFWDTQTSGLAVSAGGSGLLTSQMQNQDSFTTGGVNWDFASVWEMCPGGGYPTHQWMNYCPLDNPYEFVVNSTNDTNDAELGDRTCLDSVGNCTLRAALQELSFMQANETESVSYNLNFNIAGAGPHIITLDNSLGILPTLNSFSQVTINGESEPSFTSEPVVFIDAASITNPDGPILTVDESSGVSILGLGFINLDFASSSLVSIQNSENITLDNNFIGLDSSSNSDSSNSATTGLRLSNTNNSEITNSFFGRNLSILNNSTSNNVSQNTFDMSGSTSDSAIYIESSSQNTIESTEITAADTGIIVNEPTGQTATQNRLTQNIATGLTNKMIELQVDGIASADTNDIALDLDDGPNTLLNFPTITDGEFNPATNTLSVEGTVETANGSDYILEFYNSDGGTDEALDFLGSSSPFTVTGNSFSFDLDLTGIGITPLNTTAILIDSNGNTSQHSQEQSLNDPPSDILITQDTFAENANGAPFDTGTIGFLSTTDGDALDTHTYTLLSVDGNALSTDFAIGGFGGNEVVQNIPFDFETKNSYALLIRTTDNKGESFEKTITITVTDLNDMPPDLSPENFNISEDNASPAATLSFTDPDTVGTVNLTISGGADQNDFEISGTTLSFKAAALPLDFEDKDSYTVEVTASDGVNAVDTETFNFTITDVNEVPTVDNPQVDVNETQGQAINPINLLNIFGDLDSGTNGQLSVQAIEVGLPTLPDWLTLNAGVLSGTPTNDDVGITEIRATATDVPGLSVSDTFTITVANTNDAPEVNDQTVGSVSESGPDGTVIGSVSASDPDSPYGDTLSYSITSGNDDLDGDLILPYSIDSSTGDLTLTDQGDLDFETSQSSVLVITVTDSGIGNLTDTANVTINILDANDTAPVIISPAVYSIQENSTQVATVQVTDQDSSNSFTYSISGGLDETIFQIDELTGELSFVDPPDNETPLDSNNDNIYQVEVSVNDGNSNITTQIISIQVQNVEEDSDIQPSSSGSSGGGGQVSSPFTSSNDDADDEDSSNEGLELEIDPKSDPSLEEDLLESPQEDDGLSVEEQVEDIVSTEDDSIAQEEETTEEVESLNDDSNQNSNEITPEEDGQPNEIQEDELEEISSEQGDDVEVEDSLESESSNNSSSAGRISQVFIPNLSSYQEPEQVIVSCDQLSDLDLSDIESANLDCNPLEENIEEQDSPSILLNLPQGEASDFPGDEIFITGKVFELDNVSEVEIFVELSDGNSIVLGIAEIDELGNFSILNKRSIPQDIQVEVRARAISEQDIVSPNYPIQISTQRLRPIPTSLISFTSKPESSLLQNNDGYFSFVNTQELLEGLEVRLASEFRTRHNVYWNSVLIGSSAITGSNSDQTVVYAPKEVVQDISPYSRHKITIVAESLDNPSQKGVPLVVNYLYIPTYAYYISYLLAAVVLLLVFIVTRRKRKNKLES